MKIYKGWRTRSQTVVTVNSRILNYRFDLWVHSPDGFEWGYGGSGPSQLALALFSDYLQDDKQAWRLHQAFKWLVVARLPHSGWTLTDAQIEQVLYDHAIELNGQIR